ncbi:hypothetical protein CLAIMM_00938 [Cladophialophora immunda]|nr:hypothetical protein CLAIMM_00938 [Cladophialophora immunda]
MRSNKASIVVPDVLWLNAKTPTNFKSTSDYEQKSIIAVRAQHYSTQKRVELASLLAEQPNLESKPPHGQTVSSPAHGLTSEPRQTDNTLEQDAKGRHQRKVVKRRLPPQQRVRSTKATVVPSVGLGDSLSMLLQRGNSDPFSATPIHLSALRHSVISTIQPMSLRTIWADEVGTPNAAKILVPAQTRVYKSYMSHEAVMHALLAYCWSVLARLHPHNKELYWAYALDHETRGIRVLQPLIALGFNAGDNLEVAVQAVMLLCCAAVYRSRLDALFLHLKGLKQLIQSMGGVGGLPWIRKEIIIYLVVRVAAATGTRSILDPSSWDPGWWWEDGPRETMADLTTGCEPNLGFSSASPGTNDFPCIFMALRELVEVEGLKRLTADDEPEQINRLFRWSFLRRQAVRARILDYWCDLTEPTNAVDPPKGSPTPTTVHHASVGMCLCLALHLVMAFGLEASLLRQTWVSTIHVWHIMLLRCVQKLGFESDKIDQSHPGALDILWVYCIGAYVEQLSLNHVLRHHPNFWALYTAERVDIRWFSVRFGVVARRLGYRQYQDVAVLFEKRYVHIPSLQDSVLRKIFDFGC